MSIKRGFQNWVLALASPLLFLGALETGLRLAGSGHAPEFFVPHPGNASLMTTNPRYGERFFPKRIARTPAPVVFARAKPSGTLRVFVLGESAAMGFPDPLWGMPRQLEAVLREKTPGLAVEVINAAMTAIDSHVIREIAAECAHYQPDWFVVYTGNNEFVGPFRESTVVGAQMAFRRFRLGQWIFARGQPAVEDWKGLDAFARNPIPSGDPRLDRAYAHFRDNIRAIAEAGKNAGAKVVLSTVAVNLRDSPPFAGAQAVQAFERGAYEQARDLDELRFRADSRINTIVRDVAREQNVRLVDAAAMLSPDTTRFFEHVHLNPEGNRVLARMIAESAQGGVVETAWDSARLAASITALTARPPFTLQKDHASRQSRREEELSSLQAAIDLPAAGEAYRRMLEQEPENFFLRERYAELLREAGDAAGSAAQWRELISRLPVIKGWHTGLADALLAIGKTREAREACHSALRLDAQFTAARLNLGLARAQEGDIEGSIGEFQTALATDRNSADAHNNMGVALYSLGRRAEALAAYRKAIAIRPEFARAHDNLARALAASGQNDEAIQHYRVALRYDHRLVSAHYDLGLLLARRGDFNAAIEQYQKALAQNPANADAHNNWGTALARQGRMADAIPHFEEALRLQPTHAEARRNLDLSRRNKLTR